MHIRQSSAKADDCAYAGTLGTTKGRKSRKKIDTPSFNQKN